MKTLDVVLEGTSNLSFSRYHNAPMETTGSGAKKESHREYDERTWRQKMHITEDGLVFIPPMALKSAIEGAARYNPVKKKGVATWTKHIEAGVMIVDPVVLDGVRAAEVECEDLPMNADGKPTRYSKGGKVFRLFPLIRAGWKAKARIIVIDDQIPVEVIEQHLIDGGVFVGIGRWRAENRGLYGRYRVVSKKWSV
jgi:hypothetical protein